MLQNPNAPQSGNSTGLVMGGINLTSYPRDLLSEIEENFRDNSRPITIIFEDGRKEVCEARSDRRGQPRRGTSHSIEGKE